MVAFSVIVQGLTAPFALRWLGLVPAQAGRAAMRAADRLLQCRLLDLPRAAAQVASPMRTFAFSTFAAAQPRDFRHVRAEQRPQVVVEGGGDVVAGRR